MGERLITAAASPVATLTEAKAHMRVDITADDTIIAALVEAATRQLEGYTKRAFVEQTWEFSLDDFPSVINTPKGVLSSVTSIKYTDVDGAEQTWDAANYQVGTGSTYCGLIAPIPTESWPSIGSGYLNAIRVRCVVGWTLANVPTPLKQAVLMLAAHFYENRESVIVGTSAVHLPQSVKWLSLPFQVGGA